MRLVLSYMHAGVTHVCIRSQDALRTATRSVPTIQCNMQFLLAGYSLLAERLPCRHMTRLTPHHLLHVPRKETCAPSEVQQSGRGASGRSMGDLVTVQCSADSERDFGSAAAWWICPLLRERFQCIEQDRRRDYEPGEYQTDIIIACAPRAHSMMQRLHTHRSHGAEFRTVIISLHVVLPMIRTANNRPPPTHKYYQGNNR